MQFKRCVTDEDYAQVSLFILERKHDLHPSYTTIDGVTLIYTYITEGHLYRGEDADGRIIGVAAYYHGTPERDYKDKEVALIDIGVLDRTHRGTRLFIRGLQYLVDEIMKEHPEVEELIIAALEENTYVCKLYSKFAKFSHKRDGNTGQEVVFHERISKLRSVLQKYNPV